MAGASHNSYLGNKEGGRGGQRKGVHFGKGVEEEGWSDSFVCAEEGFFPPLYANKKAGFVWDQSKFLSSLTQISVNGYFLNYSELYCTISNHLVNKARDSFIVLALPTSHFSDNLKIRKPGRRPDNLKSRRSNEN